MRAIVFAVLLACAVAPAQLNHNVILSTGATSVVMWNGQPALVIVNQGRWVCAFSDPLPWRLTPVQLHVQAALVLDSRPCTWGGYVDLSCNDYHTPATGLRMPSGGVLFRAQPWGYPMSYTILQQGRSEWTWSYCGAKGQFNGCAPEGCWPEWNAVVCYVSFG